MMSERIEAGSWVEIRRTILAAGERAPQVPADTQAVDMEMRVKGWLVAAARIGEQVEIETAAGRRLQGRLAALNPAYDHGFGRPIPALSGIGVALRSGSRKRGDGG